MAKVVLIGNDVEGRYLFDCPGCGNSHAVNTIIPHTNGARWNFNGDVDKPTFTPSILIKTEWGDGRKFICHSYVTDGNIQFLGDCTHKLAGQTIELPEQ